MYINYKTKGDIEYAMAVTSICKGKFVAKDKPLYMGRVIDKEYHARVSNVEPKIVGNYSLLR